MRTAEPQPQMPLVKLILYLVLLFVAICLAMFLWKEGFTKDRSTFTGLLVSLMSSLFVICFVELIPEIVRTLSDRSETAKFVRFFGKAAINNEVRLVFAHRCLESMDHDPWITHYKIPDCDGKKPTPEGVNAWMPGQDIRAAVKLSNLFLRFAKRDVKFIFDKDVDSDDFDFCAISIGLGFNAFTHRLANWCENKLFSVEFGDSVKTTFKNKTDYFLLGNGFIPAPPDGKDDCIVARVVPVTSQGKSKRVCFVCAGRTAPGTAVAGYFLANHWRKLLSLYSQYDKDLDKDSLAVVVRHTAHRSGTLEFDLEARIAIEKGEQLCFWQVAEGVD